MTADRCQARKIKRETFKKGEMNDVVSENGVRVVEAHVQP